MSAVLTTDERDHVLMVIATRGLIGMDALTSLTSALSHSTTGSFTEWRSEVFQVQTPEECIEQYGHDGARAAWLYKHGPLAVAS